MPHTQIDTQIVQNAFNKIRILKGQYINIATSDESGCPNVAPIGSMHMMNGDTVRILEGALGKTMANLKKNPKATFSVCLLPTIAKMMRMFKDDDSPLGYQAYCTYMGESSDKDILKEEIRVIAKRLPFFIRPSFKKFSNKLLRRVLTFKVDHIRTIGAPS